MSQAYIEQLLTDVRCAVEGYVEGEIEESSVFDISNEFIFDFDIVVPIVGSDSHAMVVERILQYMMIQLDEKLHELDIVDYLHCIEFVTVNKEDETWILTAEFTFLCK